MGVAEVASWARALWLVGGVVLRADIALLADWGARFRGLPSRLSALFVSLMLLRVRGCVCVGGTERRTLCSCFCVLGVLCGSSCKASKWTTRLRWRGGPGAAQRGPVLQAVKDCSRAPRMARADAEVRYDDDVPEAQAG